MFYLETKDGDKFFTEKDSDDRREFSKILNEKLGRDASDLFENLISESEDNAEHILNSFRNRYKECINNLDKALNGEEVNRVKLEEILSDLQALYTDYMM